MLLAAIVVGTLLGSASVAQARRCYCSDDESLEGPDFYPLKGEITWIEPGPETPCKNIDTTFKRGITGN